MPTNTSSEDSAPPGTGQTIFLIQQPADASSLSDQDRQFITQASAANQAEIDEGNLATSHSGNTATQTFGQWMVADHTALALALNDTAQQLGVDTTVAYTPQQTQEIQNLESADGSSFDQLYAQTEVTDHQQSLALFQQEATSGLNPTLKNLAQQAIPILEQHLAGAQQLSGSPITATTPQPLSSGTTGPAAGTPSDQDISFVQFAAQSGLAEVQEGQLAIANTSNLAVREFGRWMVTDHTAVNANLQTVAQQEGITVPTVPTDAQQGEILQLQSLSPSAFAATYVNNQLDDHVNTLMQFIKEATTGQDPAIKAFAQNTVPALAEHLVGAGNLKLAQVGASSVASQILPELTGLASDLAKPGAVAQLNHWENLAGQAAGFLDTMKLTNGQNLDALAASILPHLA
jgi:putative membrane protein